MNTARFNSAYAAWTKAREEMISAMRYESSLRDPPAHMREEDINLIVRMMKSFEIHSGRADEFVQEFKKMVK